MCIEFKKCDRGSTWTIKNRRSLPCLSLKGKEKDQLLEPQRQSYLERAIWQGLWPLVERHQPRAIQQEGSKGNINTPILYFLLFYFICLFVASDYHLVKPRQKQNSKGTHCLFHMGQHSGATQQTIEGWKVDLEGQKGSIRIRQIIQCESARIAM